MYILTNYELSNKDRIQCNSDKSNWIKPNVLHNKTISIDGDQLANNFFLGYIHGDCEPHSGRLMPAQ